MLTLIRWIIVGLGLAAATVTLLSLTRSSRWPLRIWDFPRVQIAVAATVAGLAYAVLFYPYSIAGSLFLGIVLLSVCWQLYRIYPYTRIAQTQVDWSRGEANSGTRFRLLISNVQMENGQHAELLHVIQESNPDLILAVETDATWQQALLPLTESYPHHVRQAQDNYYGMLLFSRFPLLDPRIEFLVQSDIPSVHTLVALPSGDRIRLYGLHPRPPEPLRDQDSTPRDAELVLVGRAVGESPDVPTIVAGDLNDVAWSGTTRLFLRLSGLLDPRIGRGFYNSFDVHNVFCRYPLDHVFHSNHFRLVEIRRLRPIGSDHFPMLIELAYEPGAPATQAKPVATPDDAEEAENKLEEQAQAARTGADRPGRGESDEG